MKINKKILLLVSLLAVALVLTTCGSDEKLKTENEELKSEITSLEERVSELEEELNVRVDEDIVESETVEEADEKTDGEETTETVEEQIEKLISEKMDIIEQKKVAAPAEQKALGMRIGEIEREISKLRSGK